jgi:Protein of unknown function (DUF3828)
MDTFKFVLAISILLAGGGCSFVRSEPARAEAGNTGDAQVAVPQSTPVKAQKPPANSSPDRQQDTPDALVREVYKVHGEYMKVAGPKDRIMSGKSRVYLDKYFDKKLADLIWKDLTTHTNDIGVIDMDIFYNTQDPLIKNVVVAPATFEGDNANVRVSFTNAGAKETVTYSVVKEKGKWKIHDIKYANGDTLLKYFEEETRQQ